MPAGCINGLGYRVIRIDKRLYTAHRLAWLYVHGSWPSGVIDHINGDRGDNRIENLRDIPKAQNHQNLKRPPANNRTGWLGVTFSRRRQHYVAQICIDGRHLYIGSFPTAERAHEAYMRAKHKLHPAAII